MNRSKAIVHYGVSNCTALGHTVDRFDQTDQKDSKNCVQQRFDTSYRCFSEDRGHDQIETVFPSRTV